jgi:hypothetical protein
MKQTKYSEAYMNGFAKRKAEEAAIKFASYQFNYEHDFINNVFEGRMVEHLESKFAWAYNKYGAVGCFIAFYHELDSDNRIKLINYILTK